MKTKTGGQQMRWCVSVNSDVGVFVYMSVCEGLQHPCLKGVVHAEVI